MTERRSPAVFFDRDGTIIEDRPYCSDPNQVRIFSAAPKALRRLRSHGFKLIIITNQSGIGRGLFTLEQYRAVEAEVLRLLRPNLIDATYYCPDPPGHQSNCRKPAAGMILQAAREHQIDLSRSFVIGDKEVDVQCAHNAGIRAIRVKTGPESNTSDSNADWIVEDLTAAAEMIVNTTIATAPRSGAGGGDAGALV